MTLIKVKSRGTDNVTGRRNVLINGAMQVAQRGTSSTTNGYASLDRWQNAHGGGTVTQTQEALTSGSPYNDGHRNFLRATNTAAGSTAASDSLQIYQVIESQNLATSGWDSTSSSSNITVSAWVRSSLAGTYNLRLYIYDGNKNYTTPIVLSANTWTKVTKTIPGASGNTINNDIGAGMFVNFAVYLGTNNTVASGFTNNQWATFAAASQASDYAQNWRATGSATFDVTGVQLEVGDGASDFEHRSFGEELDLCHRYFFKPITQNTYSPFPIVFNRTVSTGSNGYFAFTIPLPKPMRTLPTFTTNLANSNHAGSGAAVGAGSWQFYWQNQGWGSFAGSGNMNTINRAMSGDSCVHLGNYYITPSAVQFDQLTIGKDLTLEFSAEL